jgi:small subunit ribosomal protein S16
MSKGAKLSDTAHNLLVANKIIEGKKINVLPKKTAPKKEEVKEEPKAEEKAEVKETAKEEKKEESAPAA